MGVEGATTPIRMKTPYPFASSEVEMPLGLTPFRWVSRLRSTQTEIGVSASCKPFAKPISRRHGGKQILFLLRHRRVGHVAARDYSRRGRGSGGGLVGEEGVSTCKFRGVRVN